MSKSRVEEIIDRLGDEFKAVATAGLISAGTMGAHAAEPTSLNLATLDTKSLSQQIILTHFK